MFRLALAIANSNDPVPDALADYFTRVLSQARDLDRDPSITMESVLPEAIQLALDLRERDGLRDAVEGIQSLKTVSPSQAAEVLRRLEG